MPTQTADVIVVGAGLAGLAGLVAAAEIADAGKTVLLLDQEGEQNLGGQAFWSLGGLFFVDSPEQRRLGIHDSRELATRDWMTTAQFDRAEDEWPRRWAEAYLDFAAGASLINGDRMWHYTEGLRNWNPIWENHGIRVLPGPSSLWLDPSGKRLPFPHYPSASSLDTLAHITTRGLPYTWFVLNRAIIRREFALSGSEQNPDVTGKSIRLTLERLGNRVPPPVQAFMDKGADFVVRDNLADLVAGMNTLVGDARVDYATLEREIRDRDLQLENPAGKDPQLAMVRNARNVLSERLSRVATPAPILDPADGPLIAVKLNILTRKSLGGLETDLQGRVLGRDGDPMPGLYAAGEVAGFGGGGVHGYRALEGTFLGGCIFSGRAAGRAAANAVG